MNRLIFTKILAAVGVAIGALAAASAAHARSDVYLSIGIPGYVQPAPVYVQPAPVYVQPRPVYVQPRPVYVQPQPVYVNPQPTYYGRDVRGPNYYGQIQYGDGWDSNARRHQRHGNRYGPYGDLDRDGVPNIDDRDRDGDGIRNRHDRAPSNPYYR